MDRRQFVKRLAAAGGLLGCEPSSSGQEPSPDPLKVRRVLVMFKCHLDVGFTATQAQVIRKYFDEFYPRAIETAASTRATGKNRFIWTTGSWLLYEYLEQATPEQRGRMEQAIAAGDIAWHALPFSWQTEMMDRSMIAGALGLSKSLDRRFGRTTSGAKMSDVPCHSRGIVAPLAEQGVTFLHIGANSASSTPDVPLLFLWKEPSGSSIIVMYSKRGYGGTLQILQSDLAIAINVARGDNSGPHSPEKLAAAYQDLETQFPNATITASSLTDIAHALQPYRDKLPVVTAELGDTWIYGIPSDPVKVARFREVARLRQEWIQAGSLTAGDETDRRLLSRLALSAEHTWGTDTKRYLDYDHYRPADLAKMLNSPKYQIAAGSWQEKRQNIDDAIATLPARRRIEAGDRLTSIAPKQPDRAGLKAQRSGLTFDNRHFLISIDAKTGAIHRLRNKNSGREWAAPERPLALFSYQTLSLGDFERFIASYNVSKATWVPQDFGKPRIDLFGAESRVWNPALAGCWTGRTPGGTRILSQIAIDDSAAERDGRVAWPRTMYADINVPDDKPVIEIDFSWFGKAPNRMPESMWLSFAPLAPEPKGWMLDKVDQKISPFDVVAGGNRHMHALTRDLSYEDQHGRLVIETLDAPVVSIGVKSPIAYSNEQPEPRNGVHFNLFNNAWGTNYPQWFGEDMRFRFRIHA